MIRREFLHTLSAAAVASLPRPRFPLMNDRLRTIGVQLYTLREALKQDFVGTLAEVARIGFREVEFAGLYERPAREIRGILDRHGLRAPSGHVGLAELSDGLDQTIANATTLGHKYVVLAWIPEEMRTSTGYGQLARTLNQAGAKLRKAGLTLGYHNHWFEFDQLQDAADPAGENRRTGYDLLLEQTDPSVVVMELDLYWIRKGHHDPLVYFARYPGRFHLVHVKDMAADGSMVDVGAGTIDWKAILAQAPRAGVRHYFVEHDEPADPLASARASFSYLKQLRF